MEDIITKLNALIENYKGGQPSAIHLNKEDGDALKQVCMDRASRAKWEEIHEHGLSKSCDKFAGLPVRYGQKETKIEHEA